MYQRTVLDNGLRVLVNELPHTRSVTFTIFVATGARYEEAPSSGISHFIEHMLFKGTTKRPSAQEIAVAVEGVGGAFNAATGHEMTSYWVKVANRHFDIALDVLSDMVGGSLFAPQEIEKERRVIIEEINETFDVPDELVFYDLDELMWQSHPLGRDVAGTPETVASITRDQMREYLTRHYHGNSLVVSVAGCVESAVVVDKIAKALGAHGPAPRQNYLPYLDGQHGPRWHVRNKNTEQAHVAIGTWAYPRLHPDRFVVNLLSAILGEGMSSRLFQEIRENRGLAYSVSSFGSALEDCGYFGSYAAVEPKNATPVLQAILKEWTRLKEERVPEEELVKAKELLKGHLLLSMEDTSSVASWYGRQETLGSEILTVDDVTAALDAVSCDDLMRVARDLFRKDWLNLSVVGPFRSEGRFAKLLEV